MACLLNLQFTSTVLDYGHDGEEEGAWKLSQIMEAKDQKEESILDFWPMISGNYLHILVTKSLRLLKHSFLR